MRVFLTGASGHIAGAVIPSLLDHGHEVVGLARSNDAARIIAARGAHVLRGDLDDLDGLRTAAAAADGVIHLAFKHEALRSGDFSSAVGSDLAATVALGEALAHTDRPFVSTGGTLMLATTDGQGRPGTENDRLAGGWPDRRGELHALTRRAGSPLLGRSTGAPHPQRPRPPRLHPGARHLRPRERRRRLRGGRE